MKTKKQDIEIRLLQIIDVNFKKLPLSSQNWHELVDNKAKKDNSMISRIHKSHNYHFPEGFYKPIENIW